MDADGSNVRRLTQTLGYDGGPFFSPDNRWIVYRAHHPTGDAEIARYKALLKQDLVEPNEMDLWLMRADGGQHFGRNGRLQAHQPASTMRRS